MDQKRILAQQINALFPDFREIHRLKEIRSQRAKREQLKLEFEAAKTKNSKLAQLHAQFLSLKSPTATPSPKEPTTVRSKVGFNAPAPGPQAKAPEAKTHKRKFLPEDSSPLPPASGSASSAPKRLCSELRVAVGVDDSSAAETEEAKALAEAQSAARRYHILRASNADFKAQKAKEQAQQAALEAQKVAQEARMASQRAEALALKSAEAQRFALEAKTLVDSSIIGVVPSSSSSSASASASSSAPASAPAAATSDLDHKHGGAKGANEDHEDVDDDEVTEVPAPHPQVQRPRTRRVLRENEKMWKRCLVPQREAAKSAAKKIDKLNQSSA